MLKQAKILWPKQKSQFRVPISSEGRAWLKWQGVLRRHAWMAMLDSREKLKAEHMKRGVRGWVMQQAQKGGGVRLKEGGVWGIGEALQILFEGWKKYTV